MLLEHTTTTLRPQQRNSFTKPSTTNDLPVPACPDRTLWPANAVLTTFFAHL